MDTASQIARYALVLALMAPLLGGALVIAPFSDRLGRRMVRAWNQAFLSTFGISFEVQYDIGPEQLEHLGLILSGDW